MKRTLLIHVALLFVPTIIFSQNSRQKEIVSAQNTEIIYSSANRAGSKDIFVPSEKYPRGFEKETIFLEQYQPGGPLDIFHYQSEDLDKRDQFSKHFKTEDGKYVALITSGPQHYLKNGLWNTILNKITPVNLPSFPYGNEYNTHHTYYGTSASNLVKITENGQDILIFSQPKFEFIDAQNNTLKTLEFNNFSNVSVSGEHLTYSNISPGIDLVLDQNAAGFKYSFKINSLNALQNIPDGAVSLRIVDHFNVGAGMSPVTTENNGYIEFQNGSHKIKIKQFSLYDSKPMPDLSSAKNIRFSNGNLSYEIELEWLTNTARSFPIIIDPTITYTPNNSIYWTGTVDDDSGCDFSTDNDSDENIRVGFDDGTFDNDYYSGYAQFNISSLPTNACISASYSRFYQYNFRNPESGNKCWGNDDQLSFFYGTTNPLNINLVASSCDAINTAIASGPAFALYNVFSGYTLGTANGWKAFPPSLNASITSILGSQTIYNVVLDQTGTHSDPGSQICCFCTPDNDDWLDFRGWASGDRPQLIITYETPYSTSGATANISNNNVCPGTAITLSITGGTKGSDGAWRWYAGSCGGALVGTSTAANGALNITAPTTTTTYYVRGEGACGNTSCISVTLTVLPISTAATSIISTVDTVCIGSSTTLSVNGGSLGSGANWQWYSSSCGGTAAGTGSAILVSPTTTTTYFVRAIGTCNTTACINKTIYVSTPSVGGSLSASTLSPCAGLNFSVSLTGNSGSVLYWERDFNGGGYSNIGNPGVTTLNQTGLAAGTYTYRAFIKNGACAGVYSNTVTVNVIPATVGGSTYAFNTLLCEGSGTLVSLSGHTGNILYWEQQVNGGGFTNAGNPGSANFSTGILTPGVYEFRAVIQNGSCSTVASNSSIVTVTANTIAGTTNITPDTICIGTPLTVNLTGNVGTVVQWERDISGSGYVNIGGNNTNPLTITPNTPGLHTYRAIVQSGACSSLISASDVVYVRPIGNANITYSAATYCTNSGSNPVPIIQTPGGTFSASPAGLVFTNTSTGEINLSASTAGTYTITYQLPSQYCNGTGTAIVTINTGVTPTLDYFSNVFCSADPNVTPAVTPMGGTFSVSPSGLQLSPNGTLNLAASTPGSYVVTYTTGGACASSANYNITVNATPNPSITGPTIFCSNGAVTQINATPVGGTFMGGAFISTGGQFDPTIAGPGVHMLVYESISPQGCIGYATTNIQVNTAPVVTIVAPLAQCDNSNPIAVNATPVGGTWSGPFINSSGVFDPTAAGAGTYALTYSYTDANNCTTIGSTNITVNTSPDATINTPPTFCSADAPSQLSGVTAGGAWSGPSYISATGMFDPSISGPGSFPVTYTVTSGSCTSSSTTNVMVSATPNSTINPVAPLCSNSTPIQISAATPGGAYSGGAFITSAGIFDPSIAGNGTHNISYSVTVGACTSTSTLPIVVNAAPTPSFTSLNPVLCSADPGTLIAASPAGGSYSGNPYITIGGIFDPNLSGAGIFPVIYTVNANGCTASINNTITVNASPNATFTVPSGNTMCSSDGPTTFNPVTSGGTWSGGPYISAAGIFTPSLAGPGIHAVTYTVTNGGCSDTHTENISVSAAPSVNILSPTNMCLMDGTSLLFANTPGGVWTGNSGYISGAGLFDPIIAGAGTHLVVYTVYGGNGCAGFDSTYISVYANPDATITYPGAVCENAGIQTLTSVTPGGTWSGGVYVNNNLFDPAVAGPGNHIIIHQVTSAQGCSSQDTIVVTVNPLPTASYTNQNNGLISYLTDQSLNATSWSWDFGDGSPTDNNQNPTHNFPDNGTYYVRLIVGNACGTDTIIKQIYVNKALSVEDVNTDTQISLYPNPSKENITLKLDNPWNGEIGLKIIDMSGKTVRNAQFFKVGESIEINISVSDLATGVYAISINHNGNIYHARFIKQQ